MKRIYDFSCTPAAPNYTAADLQTLKRSDEKLSMSNLKVVIELRACIGAGIDLMVVGDSQVVVN